ncbi:MAG: tetratricopeptide repeat protein [Acholeplasmataceae bacterium]|nr:tetratricopeptide repeat protein [Acholeplasmataceae bacterium]
MNAHTHYQAGLSNYILNTPKKNIMVAIEHFTQAAVLGHADAHYFLGRFYGLGDGISLDFTKAKEHYEKGVSLGSYKCGYALGLIYHTGMGVEKDDTTAKDYFKQNYSILLTEAESKDPVSMHILGTYFYYGFHVQRYIFKAIEWFLKASELGYSDSQYMLGMIYETIGHDNKDKEKASHYYELAAKQDHPYAQYALGINAIEEERWKDATFYLEKAANQQYALAAYSLAMYYHEKEAKYPLKAFEWFMVAAKQGHTESEYYVGLYYQNGKGVPQNIEQAVYWLEKAAVKKDKNALYHLAMILIKEEMKDYKTIAKLLEQAAALDHPHAQYNLAVMYQKGDGVPQNMQKSFFWYEKAAGANLAIAQYNLGMIYFEGSIVEKDEAKAKELWQKAADQGLEAAVKLMLSINNYEKLQKSTWQS